MNRTLLFLTLFLFGAFATRAQSPDRVTVAVQKAPLKQLIGTIEQSTSYRFFFVDSWIDTVKVSVSVTEQPVSEVLNLALTNTPIKFFILANHVILTRNVFILDKIDSSLFKEFSDRKPSKWDYSFQRELTDISGDTEKINTVKEIGTKQKTLPGRVTLAGYVKEKRSGESITGALVYLQGSDKIITSDQFGFYSISLPPGAQTLIVKFVGMNDITQRVIVHSDGTLNFMMDEKVTLLREITVESDNDVNVSNLQMGTNKIDIRSMKNIPKVLGENDVFKIVLTLPGVKTVGEGAAGINVRGGNADQNLVLLNEATIYNTSHFLGFFSVFNADAIKSFELYKSGIPAQFGGRLSSVFELQMKDGNQKKFSGQGGIGPITSHLTFEVPLIKDRTSIMFGGRSTYSDWVLNQIPKSKLKNGSASFNDFFTRVSHTIDNNNSVYLSLYYSKDKYNLTFDSLFSYHNAVGSLQWRHVFNSDFHSIVSVTHSEYAYDIDYSKVKANAFDLGFNIRESNFKWELSYFKGRHKIDYGVQGKLYQLNPGFVKRASAESIVTEQQVQQEKGLESAIHFADNLDITQNLSVYLGLRYSAFTALGPGTQYTYTQNSPRNGATVEDTTAYAANKPMQTYHGPEYRFALRYRLGEESSVKFSYNRTRQYIHMLSNTVSVSPTNTWKLSDSNIKPLVADQVSIGYYKDFHDKVFEFSVEGYYKWIKNIVDYKTGAALVLNRNIETDVIQGTGKAYGVEFLIRKKSGKFNGWVGYTYSRTLIRQSSKFPEERINGGNFYPASYDKPHDFTAVTNFKITRRYSFSFNFTYSTGRPITYPVGLYKFGGSYRINYSDRNQFRIPDYIRADIGFNIEGNHKVKKLAHSFWSISVYNLLGRKNPYSIYFTVHDNRIQGYKLSVFGSPIPTITYNFRF
jgi:hypothetical protein